MYKKNAKKDQFRDALITCMRTKNFSDVTISDLSRVSNVSRVTFYRYFSNTTDVMEYLCDSLFDETEGMEELKLSREDSFVIALLQYLMDRSDMLDAIYRSRRIDLFQRSMARHVNEISLTLLPGMTPLEIEYIKAAYTSAFSAAFAAIISVWAQNGKKETPEDILRIFKNDLIHK